MSGNKNKDLSFQTGIRRPTISRYSDLTDPQGNLWQVEVSGVPESVRQFAKKRELLVSAKSLTTQEVAERQAEAKKRQMQIDLQRAAAEELHIPLPRPELPLQRGQPYPKLPDMPLQPRPYRPALIVKVELAEPEKLARPYAISFATDPTMNAAHWPEWYYLGAYPAGSTVYVSQQCQSGNVYLGLSTGRSYQTSWAGASGAIMAQPANESWWMVSVNYFSGDPVVYSLFGDITVF